MIDAITVLIFLLVVPIDRSDRSTANYNITTFHDCVLRKTDLTPAP